MKKYIFFLLLMFFITNLYSQKSIEILFNPGYSRITAGDHNGYSFKNEIVFNRTELFSFSFKLFHMHGSHKGLYDLYINDTILAYHSHGHRSPGFLSNREDELSEGLIQFHGQLDKSVYNGIDINGQFNFLSLRRHKLILNGGLTGAMISETYVAEIRPAIDLFTGEFYEIMVPIYKRFIDVGFNTGLRYKYNVSDKIHIGTNTGIYYFFSSTNMNIDLSAFIGIKVN